MASMEGHTCLRMCKLSTLIGSYSDLTRPARVNIEEASPIERTMTTGLHIVRDITCCNCSTVLGWKYVRFIVSIPEYRTESVSG